MYIAINELKCNGHKDIRVIIKQMALSHFKPLYQTELK